SQLGDSQIASGFSDREAVYRRTEPRRAGFKRFRQLEEAFTVDPEFKHTLIQQLLHPTRQEGAVTILKVGGVLHPGGVADTGDNLYVKPEFRYNENIVTDGLRLRKIGLLPCFRQERNGILCTGHVIKPRDLSHRLRSRKSH